MADQDQPSAPGANNNAVIQPQNIYLKDVSFETPNSPDIFTKKWEPKVDIQMNSSDQDLGDDIYEVVLSFTVTVTVGGETAYLAEVHQAGIFSLKGLTPEQLHQTQHVFCLGFLHPYAIAAILDIVMKGGFPQFLMPPVNFAARYKAMQDNAKSAGKAGAT